MEYTIQTPALWGETVALYSVALAMADHRANASGRGFHKSEFDRAVPQFTNILLTAAESGRLQVCNQFGGQGTPNEIYEQAITKGQIPRILDKESQTLATHVFVRLHHLNI